MIPIETKQNKNNCDPYTYSNNSTWVQLQRTNIFNRGLKGYENLRMLDRAGKRPLHRRGKDTLKARYRQKLMGKTEWYKNRSRIMYEWEEEELTQYKGGWGGGSRPAKPHNPANNQNPVAILFVPRTPGGELITNLRAKEETLTELTGRKTKLVEKAGLSLKDMLWKADPWGGPPCPRANCRVCENNKEEVICRTKNLIYANVCLICKTKGEDTRYIGETSRSLGQRAGEHWDKCVATRGGEARVATFGTTSQSTTQSRI